HYNCDHNEIIGNTIGHGAVYIASSNYNSFINNVITNAWSDGLMFDHAEYNIITRNTISNNGTAINFHACNYNTITENTISGNSSKGIYMPNCMCGGCKFNNIYHNNWINNGQHVHDECTNNWDNGYPSGGNFWDDYTGVDNFSGPGQNIPGSDSIGDTPYLIPGGNEKDFYPLMEPYGMPPLANVVFVDDDYDENTPGWGYDHFAIIQNGISFVSFGGTVNVANGVYFENINIGKQISLFGETKDSTIIDGGSSGNVISISSDSISIYDFTIRNGYSGSWSGAGILTYSDSNRFYNNIITDNYIGMRINTSSNNHIINNHISNSNSSGILMYDNCDNNRILNNNIQNNNNGGISIYDKSDNNLISFNEFISNNDDGILITEDCDNNNFTNNLISGNNGHGISIGLYNPYLYSSNTMLKHNIITNNIGSGICCDKTNSTDIIGNRICENSEYGIKLVGSSTGTQIYHNTFVSNVSGNAYDENSNTWHNGYSTPFNPSTDGGNYWSDYTGPDIFHGPNQDIVGSDGIGDILYNIPGGSNVDQYPFIEPNGWNISVSLKVFLEGAYNPDEVIPILNSIGLIPLSHPYSSNPWYYNGYEGVTDIPNSDIVDWVLVELRDTTQAEYATGETMIAQQAAFLLNDGSVVGLDGFSILSFNHSITHSLFVVIWQRNHLGIMSANPVTKTGDVYTYNFSTGANQAYGSSLGHKEIVKDVWGMIGGDGNADNQIANSDKNDVWAVQAGTSGYLSGDFTMDTQVNNTDKNDVWVPNSGKGGQVPDNIPQGGFKCMVPR
ncbi:MAG: right-handed parallel beta-helix repeat-containing protein, partial [Bacteroidales bacterium]|nr:right-handed parallel beta-helix repeat-containing protein [Bacteroidales bacterium]